MNDIYYRFRDYVSGLRLIRPSERILLSLSAGKDSMFMLHLVRKLQAEIGFTIGVFHLNHLTRGDDSDNDELFLKAICEKYNIPFYAERFDFEKNRAQGSSFEEQARDKRYLMIADICRCHGYDKAATAHNMNDNAETILMRALSGTGIAGLKGILPENNNIIRPVLFADKNEIYSYLEANGIEWREDRSNTENIYLRNYLRNVVIPSIVSRIHNAEENLNNLSSHAAENQALIYSLADMLYPDAVKQDIAGITIDITDFKDNMPLIKFYISRVLYENYGMRLTIPVFNEILRRYKINSANVTLYEIDDLIVRKGRLNNRIVIIINSKQYWFEELKEWEYNIPSDENITINLKEIRKELNYSYVSYDFYINNKDNPGIIFLQPIQDINRIIIRNRRPGDRIEIENGSKKIKDIMIEKKLDSKIKNNIPLIVADNQVAAYLPGLLNSNNNRVACNFHIVNDIKRILAFFFRDI